MKITLIMERDDADELGVSDGFELTDNVYDLVEVLDLLHDFVTESGIELPEGTRVGLEGTDE